MEDKTISLIYIVIIVVSTLSFGAYAIHSNYGTVKFNVHCIGPGNLPDNQTLERYNFYAFNRMLASQDCTINGEYTGFIQPIVEHLQ